MVLQCEDFLHCFAVAVEAVTGDLAERIFGDVAEITVGFAAVNIGDMDVHGGDFGGFERVENGERSVRVRARVYDDAVLSAARFLNFGNDFALAIRLKSFTFTPSSFALLRINFLSAA